MSTTAKGPLAPVLNAAIYGERNRGSGGVVFCNHEKKIIQYMLISEFEAEEFRDKLGDILSEEGNEYYFVVEEIDRSMHIWKIPRNNITEDMLSLPA